MIHLTRLNHSEFVLNAELIEHIEATPDTVVTLVSGTKFVVLETVPQVVALAQAYKARLAGMAWVPRVEERAGPGGAAAENTEVSQQEA